MSDYLILSRLGSMGTVIRAP